jgi:hypothetical protein
MIDILLWIALAALAAMGLWANLMVIQIRRERRR